jgi:CRP-like cAMP-binding protein
VPDQEASASRTGAGVSGPTYRAGLPGGSPAGPAQRVEASIHLPEVGTTTGAGVVLGEISMFSPDRARTATAVCATDGELLAMSEDKVRQLYFQDPKFGFHMVHLITRRLLENCASLEALPGRWPDPERLRVREAA